MGMISFQFPGLPNVRCLFTGREHDLSCHSSVAVVNRQLILEKSPGLEVLAEVRQVHGTTLVQEGTSWQPGTQAMPILEADGMMTDKPGLGLLIKTADCQPILVAHNSGRFILALHVGWRGNRQNFPQIAIKQFCQNYGLSASDLRAVRGPSLGNAQFINFAEEWGNEFAPWHDPVAQTMDLWQLTAYQLETAGIPHAQIYSIDICTSANSHDYFSWRSKKDAGRQAGIVWLMPMG